MKLSRRPAQILRAFALVANGLFVPLSLLGGLLSMVADIGPGEARSALVWSIILAAAASTVLVVLLSSENRRLLVSLAYLAAIGLLGFSFWLWIDHFNLLGLVFPPSEAIALGCLAVADLLALLTNRPLHLGPVLNHRPSRYALVVVLLVVGSVVTVQVTILLRRIAPQYSHTTQFLRLGGGVRWEDGWVTGLYLKATSTSDDDLRHLPHFPQLRSLYLSDTQVTDAGLTYVADLRSVEHLYLDNTAVTDQGLKHLSGLVNLRSLWIDDTEVTDNGLVYLEGMVEMADLYLGNTHITDAGLPHLHRMKQLHYLHVPGTQVTEKGLRSMAEMIPGLRAYNGQIQVGFQR